MNQEYSLLWLRKEPFKKIKRGGWHAVAFEDYARQKNGTKWRKVVWSSVISHSYSLSCFEMREQLCMLTAIQQPLCSLFRSQANGGRLKNDETGRYPSFRCSLTSLRELNERKNDCTEGDSALRFDHSIRQGLKTPLGKRVKRWEIRVGHVGEGVCRVQSQST